MSLGGSKLSARASADNFSAAEIILAIRYAHLHKRKVYLTVNTLLKENEIEELPIYLEPLYYAGLDAVIVQDIGVIQVLHEKFPLMELHASTQMSITGRYGAEYLKELGATRIVPARELSLSEIIKIKETVGIEIEAFVHGAMCYSYSGNCLFSSLLGGRSGNRGRCAQPCRLPYQVNAQPNEFKNTKYPLSLKDLCTLQDIPRLIQAGIDSFKIEGRMKKPEYAAGVTALHRKYIDSYLSESSAPFAVECEDMLRLSSLYLRSEISNGYYDRQNDRNMVTPDMPSYNGTDDALLLELKQKHMEEKLLVPVSARLVVKIDEPLLLTVSAFGTTVTVMEGKVLEAQKQPTTEADFQKQLSKTGGTDRKSVV